MEARDSPLFTLINGLGKQVDSNPGTPGELSDSATAVEDPLDLEKFAEAEERKRRHSLSSLRNAPLLFALRLFPIPNFDLYLLTSLLSHHRSIQQAKSTAIREMRESSRPKEVMQQGQVKTKVYKSYISAASTTGVIFFLLATFAAQGASIAGNL